MKGIVFALAVGGALLATATTIRITPAEGFEAAREKVRAVRAAGNKGTIIVNFVPGVYRQSKVVQFDKNWNGEGLVVFKAERRGTVRITGGAEVGDFKPLKPSDPAWNIIQAGVRDKIRVADLRAAGVTDFGNVDDTMFVWRDAAQTLARWPDDSFIGIASVAADTKDEKGGKIHAKEFVYKDDRVGTWVNEKDIRANGFFRYNWAAQRIDVAKIDPETKTVYQGKCRNAYGFGREGFWFGYNLLCELDKPGEYYLDRTTGRLYFYPVEATARGKGELTISQGLLYFTDVNNLALDGFVFENCRGTSLYFRGGRNISITACEFRNVTSSALVFTHSTNSRVAGCDFCNIGKAAVGITAGDMKILAHGNVTVDNCHFSNFSLLDLTYAPAVRMDGCGVTVSNCTIHDAPHVAILFGGREHSIINNEIHSVCVEAGEMGAIYCGRNWTLCGNRIIGNYIHDIYNPRSQRNRAMMLDDGCAGITMISNRMVRVAEGISLSAIGNVIKDNVFEDCHPPISAWQKWEHHEDYTNPRYTHKQLLDTLAEVPVHEEPWKTRYPYLAMIDEAIKTGKLRDAATRTAILDNATDAKCDGFVAFMGARYAYSPETWNVANNTTNNTAVAQALAAKLPKKVGCYQSGERHVWPVVHPVKIKYGNLVYTKKK